MAKTIFGGAHSALVAVLVEARKAAGLRQADVAERIGRNQSHVSLVEMGQRRVDVIEFLELARALEADPRALLEAVIQRIGGS